MKKLKLTGDEELLLLKDIQHTFDEVCKHNINDFEYTKSDVKDFLDAITDNTVISPTLMITADAYTKMYELVKQSPVEIQWHMLVDRNLETNTYTVTDVILFPQTNSGASTTSDQNEFAKWQMNLIQNLDFPLEKLRGHGHSHVNMGVYSSGIDDTYQRDLITKVEDGDYYVFLVLNKKMDMFALIYDFHNQIMFETKDIKIEITYAGEDIRAWCTEQIEKYCKSATPERRLPPNTSYKSPVKTPEEELISTMLNPDKRSFGRRR